MATPNQDQKAMSTLDLAKSSQDNSKYQLT
jgi:hypothetical protein